MGGRGRGGDDDGRGAGGVSGFKRWVLPACAPKESELACLSVIPPVEDCVPGRADWLVGSPVLMCEGEFQDLELSLPPLSGLTAHGCPLKSCLSFLIGLAQAFVLHVCLRRECALQRGQWEKYKVAPQVRGVAVACKRLQGFICAVCFIRVLLRWLVAGLSAEAE